MPAEGSDNFKILKKQYSKGSELRGKTLGIVGFGRIGKSLASYALGCGMNVIAHDRNTDNGEVEVNVGDVSISVDCKMMSMESVLKNSDAVSLHIPAQENGGAVIGTEELAMMKPGAILLNAARGGVVDEDALLAALDSGAISGAALDVFVGEPAPRADVLAHPSISLTPHTGAATSEAQDRIGLELAAQIAELFKINFMRKLVRPFRLVQPPRHLAHLVASRSYLSYDKSELQDKLDRNPYSYLQVINPDAKKEIKEQKRHKSFFPRGT